MGAAGGEAAAHTRVRASSDDTTERTFAVYIKMYFRGKKHARTAYNRLRKLDGRPADARRFVRDAVEAERAFEQVCAETTKQTIKRDKAAEITARLEARQAMTRVLGGALEETGLLVFFADTMEDSIKSGRPFRPPVSIHMPGDEPGTELVHKLTNIRRVNFFPEHAAQKHAQLERQLAAYVHEKLRAGAHISMMTFNGGGRWREGAATGRLREGRGEMRRAMTLLFRSKLFRRWFTPEFIGEEHGTPKGRYSRENGAWKWHLHTHAHTLQRVHAWCPDFNRLMTWVRLRYHECLTGRRFPGLRKLMDFDRPLTPGFQAEVEGWMKESQALALVEYDGAIRDVQEVCKYPFKDKDLTTLHRDGGAQPIRDLYDNLFRARLCTPLNSFRRWRKDTLFERPGFRKKTIARKSPGEGGCAFALVNDWNNQTPNCAEAISERKKRAEEITRIRQSQAEKTERLKVILKSRLKEWSDFQESPLNHIESFPRNDFRLPDEIVQFDYRGFSSEYALKLEITRLFTRLISSSGLFDLAVPAFVLESLRRFPERIQTENAVFFEIAAPERPARKPLRNFVTARTAPSFLGGGTIARPGIVVVGATDDGRVWRTSPLARRLERMERPHIAAAAEQRDLEAALPDFAPPADGGEAYNACARGVRARDYKGCSQTPLNFPFYNQEWAAAPPGNADFEESTALAEA